MNKQDANRTIGKYVGTLKADSKTREVWKGESTKKFVEYIIFSCYVRTDCFLSSRCATEYK